MSVGREGFRAASSSSRRRTSVRGRLLVATITVCILCALPVLGGCSSRETLHPALRASDDDISRGIRRGKGLIGRDPGDVFTLRLQDVNVRVSSDIILRSAGCCWPQDEICYRVAAGGDKSDAAVNRAVNEALKTVERELRCVAVVQLPIERDPAKVDFVLRTNLGVEYPPIAVEMPKLLREIDLTWDNTQPRSGLYYYVVRFPIRGGPGVPPVGPNVRSVSLVLRDGDAEGLATFDLPRPRTD